MTVHSRNAPQLTEPPGYRHYAVATGRQLVFTAGQVPLDASGNLVGEGDVARQAEQVIANLLVTLQAAGVAPDEVAKTTVYVVGDQATKAETWSVVRRSPVASVPSTLVGVASLGYRGQLVEIEAIAVID
jgi:enamine deaminase RidA (YjgF/YER057c/UK114 family)